MAEKKRLKSVLAALRDSTILYAKLASLVWIGANLYQALTGDVPSFPEFTTPFAMYAAFDSMESVLFRKYILRNVNELRDGISNLEETLFQNVNPFEQSDSKPEILIHSFAEQKRN